MQGPYASRMLPAISVRTPPTQLFQVNPLGKPNVKHWLTLLSLGFGGKLMISVTSQSRSSYV
jgi:hypothetical protein